MLTIPLSTLVISPERQRQEFDATDQGELNESIQTHGLISPVIVRLVEGIPYLVAGERRVRAVSLLATLGICIKHAGALVPPGHIPALDFGSLTALEQQEIEYAENAYRSDLTWQENVRATERLHALRTAQAAAKSLPAPTPSDTAQEIFGRADGSYRDTVKSSLVIAKHMDNPAVAKASSLKEAVKIVRRAEDITRREHLATLQGTKSLSDKFKCYNAETLEWMKGQPDAQFDVILTDPPYGMDADTFGDAAGRMSGIDHNYTDGADETHALLKA